MYSCAHTVKHVAIRCPSSFVIIFIECIYSVRQARGQPYAFKDFSFETLDRLYCVILHK